MGSKQRISRRHFLSRLGWTAVLPFAWIAHKMIGQQRLLDTPTTLEVPVPSSEGVYFHGPVIVIREKDNTKLFLSKCTHLGCRIKDLVGEALQCPCHGSRYDFDGKVIEGPASGPLKRLSFKPAKRQGYIAVEL